VSSAAAKQGQLYRPYWARSTSATFNNFGSTIGRGAGINLFREFGPGIRQMVKGHAPKLESGVEALIANDQTAKEGVSTPARECPVVGSFHCTSI
jgi:hypothetical protein